MLELLEGDERLRFTFDGQLMPIDDYLEIRPDSEPRIRSLVEAGRLAIGPWQSLTDEFLVSGESIVRNLETGLARADELGGAMRIGYLPDMFGHVAQMPQILRRAGIKTAVVWRGVPAAIDEHGFSWEAPDGSSVRTEYLPDGYGNGAYLFDLPGRPVRLRAVVERLRPFFGDDEPLVMVGTDHMPPVRDLLDRVSAADLEATVETLAGYFERPADKPRLTWRGELRSAARANLLPGVLSARIDLKAACARAERALARYAEPLQALYGDVWPSELLGIAWSRIFQNAAHDSICGCSIDATSAQVLVRYAEAEQIGDELTCRALDRIAKEVPRSAVAVVNPSPHERTGVVELSPVVPDEWSEVALETADGTRVKTQEMRREEPLVYETVVPGSQVGAWLERRLHGRELFGRSLNGCAIDARQLTLEVGEAPDPAYLDVGDLVQEIELATAAESAEWIVRIVARPRRTLLAAVVAPPLGWTSVRPVEGQGACDEPVRVDGRVLRNGELEVEALDDGTLRVNGISGVARLVDGGDFGDSYNYAPPASDLLVDEPEAVSVETPACGPVLGVLETTRRYRWPRAAADGSSRLDETRAVEVVTRAELRVGEPFVRVRIDFENSCADHRLRVHVPLARLAETSFAEGQFAVVERGPVPEEGWGERPLATYPAHGFVDAGGVALLLEHAAEFELLGERELALTALRSIGLISRSAHPWREEPAGPELAIPAAQCRGPWSFAFAIYPHDGQWDEAGVLVQAERYRHGFRTVPGTTDGTRLTARSGPAIRPDDVALSSLRCRGLGIEARVINEHAHPRMASVADADIELAAWEIRALQLEA